LKLGLRLPPEPRVVAVLDNQVKAAQRVVRQGTVAQLERRLAEYRASLDLMRQLVPNGGYEQRQFQLGFKFTF
jgi:hypothetical protein